MTQNHSPAELAAIRKEFHAQADRAFDQMFGDDGQNGLVTFTEREDRASEVTDGMSRWLLEEHLGLDAAVDPGVQVDCPICHGPVRCDSPDQVELEIRALQTRRGKVEYERAARRCPRCRAVFFPPG